MGQACEGTRRERTGSPTRRRPRSAAAHDPRSPWQRLSPPVRQKTWLYARASLGRTECDAACSGDECDRRVDLRHGETRRTKQLSVCVHMAFVSGSLSREEHRKHAPFVIRSAGSSGRKPNTRAASGANASTSLLCRMPARASQTLVKSPTGRSSGSRPSRARERSGICESALRVAATIVASAVEAPTLFLGVHSSMWEHDRAARGCSHVAGTARRAREVRSVRRRDDDLDGGAAAVDAEVPAWQID